MWRKCHFWENFGTCYGFHKSDDNFWIFWTSLSNPNFYLNVLPSLWSGCYIPNIQKDLKSKRRVWIFSKILLWVPFFCFFFVWFLLTTFSPEGRGGPVLYPLPLCTTYLLCNIPDPAPVIAVISPAMLLSERGTKNRNAKRQYSKYILWRKQ